MSAKIVGRSDIIPLLAEVFRTRGFEGASLSAITKQTGLGKGSLYHFFPGGKEEMAHVVLAEIREWFETQVFKPLREESDPLQAIDQMLRHVETYFESGQRVCLVGAFALGDVRDKFATHVNSYFKTWIRDLSAALTRTGVPKKEARARAEAAVLNIQGAIVLTRSLNDTAIFSRTLSRLRKNLLLK